MLLPLWLGTMTIVTGWARIFSPITWLPFGEFATTRSNVLSPRMDCGPADSNVFRTSFTSTLIATISWLSP